MVAFFRRLRRTTTMGMVVKFFVLFAGRSRNKIAVHLCVRCVGDEANSSTNSMSFVGPLILRRWALNSVDAAGSWALSSSGTGSSP